MSQTSNLKEHTIIHTFLSSSTGKIYLSESISSNSIMNNYMKQVRGSTCGITSIGILMNAKITSLMTNTNENKKDNYKEQTCELFDESRLISTFRKYCYNIPPMNKLLRQGITLNQIGCLLKNIGCKYVQTYHSENVDSRMINNFRYLIKKTFSNCNKNTYYQTGMDMGIICNFRVCSLYNNGSTWGHFSPIAGYHEQTDKILLLDTKRNPIWVDVNLMCSAMNTKDCGIYRGYILVIGLPTLKLGEVVMSQDRDELLVLNINKWFSNDDITLPPDLDHLNNWDIYETLHDDNITIATIGCVINDNDNTNTSDLLSEFLEESDDEENEDDDIKLGGTNNIEQLRIVFDFKKSDEYVNNKPKVLAIYHKQNDIFTQIYKTNKFNDNEIHSICIENNNDNTQECDLSLLFKSLSKKQLINGIKSFVNKNKNKNILNKLLIKNINELMIKDEEYLKLIAAQMVGIDEKILLEFNVFIDNDLQILKKQFEKNIINLKNNMFDSNYFDDVLNDIEQIIKKANSLSQLKQKEIALNLLISTVKMFLIDYLLIIDIDDLNDMNIENNSKLNYKISEIEASMEHICNGINVNDNKEMLIDLGNKLKKWQKMLLEKIPIFGPLFSDNIRALNKRLNKKKRKIIEIQHNNKCVNPKKKSRNK